MKNPWKKINLDDYENHMKLESVFQLQTMNSIMKEQLSHYFIRSVMILGIAGGNGLEHVDTQTFEKVYGVDINPGYLTECSVRYPQLNGILETIVADLTNDIFDLPYVDLIVANLFIEYIGYTCFQKIVEQVKPHYVSCVIQVNTDTSFVSDSPYLHVFDELEQVHHEIQPEKLANVMLGTGYSYSLKEEYSLPNGKKLIRLDFSINLK